MAFHIAAGYFSTLIQGLKRTNGIEVFPGLPSGSHLGRLELTVHLVFFGRLCNFSVFLQQRLQCHPQAEVRNTFDNSQNVIHLKMLFTILSKSII